MDKLIAMYQEAFKWDQVKLDAVHLAMGCYLAPRWPGRPSTPWAVLIGPPSCGKSTLLGMFNGFQFTIDVDHLTRNALTSCYADEDNPELDHSFFRRLSYSHPPEGCKVWLIQELSSLLSSDPATLEKQLADIRAAHVGKHSSHGGMGGTRVRDIGAFGLLVGTTEAFESVRARMNTFGDRFLCIRMQREADTLDALMGDANTAWASDSVRMDKYKKAIQDETHRILTTGIERVGNVGNSGPTRTPDQDSTLAAWSTIHSIFATGPVSSTLLVTSAGRPFRIVEQVKSWGNTHATMCGRDYWDETEMRVARRIFQDSMPRGNFDLLFSVHAGTCRNSLVSSDLLRQWHRLGAVEAADGVVRHGSDQAVRLTPAYARLIEGSGYFSV